MKVAIRVVNKHSFLNEVYQGNQQRFREGIQNEVDILNELQGEFVVRLYHHVESENYVFMVMEYFEGGTLKDNFEKVGQATSEVPL